MGKPFWYPELLFIFSTKIYANPFSKSLRIPSKIDCNIKYLTLDYTNQLSLGSADLIVQPSQDTL